jgi:hypothetical protein
LRSARLQNVRVGSSYSTASEFESLSPIFFCDAHELEAKLDALQPPRTKPGRPKADRDNSQLNKAYQEGRSGIERGQFENTRYDFN